MVPELFSSCFTIIALRLDDEEERVGSALTGWLPGSGLDVNKDGFIKGEVVRVLRALVPGLADVLLVGEVVGRSEAPFFAVWSSLGAAFFWLAGEPFGAGSFDGSALGLVESPLGRAELFFPGLVCISEELPVALGRLIMMGVDFLVSVVFSPSGGVSAGVDDLDLEDWRDFRRGWGGDFTSKWPCFLSPSRDDEIPHEVTLLSAASGTNVRGLWSGREWLLVGPGGGRGKMGEAEEDVKSLSLLCS